MNAGWDNAVDSTDVAPRPRDAAGLERRESGENFPVALRVLPARYRTDLHAIYAFARTVDDLGDDPGRTPAQRTIDLHAFGRDLQTVWTTGRPTLSALRQLAPVVAARSLPAEPFERLVQANLRDQTITHYDSFEQLRDYCRYSADPVGRLVLAVFDQADPTTVACSDQVCTALQLLEHWQDVAEDHRAGRIYLPQEDRDAYGVTEHDLAAPTAGPELRALMAFETDRALALLHRGTAIVGRLHGWARLAVAGYVAGGLATARALHRSGGDVLTATPRPRPADVATALAGLLLRAQRSSVRVAQ
jgi:squalene synthase HpnC